MGRNVVWKEDISSNESVGLEGSKSCKATLAAYEVGIETIVAAAFRPSISAIQTVGEAVLYTNCSKVLQL
jgi:hypothetical protein